jgi:hypothetical protein
MACREYQVPTYVAVNPPEGLYLVRNVAATSHPWSNTAAAEMIGHLTENFQLTAAFQHLYASRESACCLVIVGPPGAGKSTALASLASRSEFKVDAVAFLNEAITSSDLARMLRVQLDRSLGVTYADARAEFALSTTSGERQVMSTLMIACLASSVVGSMSRPWRSSAGSPWH